MVNGNLSNSQKEENKQLLSNLRSSTVQIDVNTKARNKKWREGKPISVRRTQHSKFEDLVEEARQIFKLVKKGKWEKVTEAKTAVKNAKGAYNRSAKLFGSVPSAITKHIGKLDKYLGVISEQVSISQSRTKAKTKRVKITGTQFRSGEVEIIQKALGTKGLEKVVNFKDTQLTREPMARIDILDPKNIRGVVFAVEHYVKKKTNNPKLMAIYDRTSNQIHILDPKALSTIASRRKPRA